MRSLFGVIHRSDQTMIFWDCILFFAARAFCEKRGIEHHAFHTVSPFCPDQERCAAVRQAWAGHNAETQVTAATAAEFLAILNAA